MILVDANQIAISHLMVRNKIENGINIDSVRRSIIRVIGRIQKKFKSEFGAMVLCYDDKNYWRREIFPFYKKSFYLFPPFGRVFFTVSKMNVTNNTLLIHNER